MRGPFDFEHADPWSSDVIDVESLNAAVSDAILERIEAVRRAAPLGPRSLSSSTLLVLGPAGSGKTHLFVRVRRRSGPRAAFVLVRPEIGVEGSPRHVLSQIVDSLRHPASGTTDKQLDVIAASMLAVVVEDRVGPHVLLEQLRNRDEATREELIERVTARLEELYPQLWTDYLEKLLRAPFLPGPDRRAANAWLAGRELNDVQLSRLGGGASSLADSDVLPALRTLAIVAAHGAPIVLVFDQLENLVAVEHRAGRIAAHGNLVSELHDTVPGLVIVQMALDAEWERNIRPNLAASHRSRVEARLLELGLPNPNEREALVRAWLERVPAAELGGGFPAPFSVEQWRAWQSALVMTPRMLMIACREAYAAGAAAAPLPAIAPTSAEASEHDGSRLGQLFDVQLDRSRAEIAGAAAEGAGIAAERLASALFVAAEIADLRPEMGVDRVTRVVSLRAPGRELRVVQHAHPRSVAAALEHAASVREPSRVVAVREQTLPFPPTWLRVEERAQKLAAAGARLVWIEAEDVARLLALHDFTAAGRSQDLARDDGQPFEFDAVRRWIVSELGWREWSVVGALLFDDRSEDVSPEVGPRPAPGDSRHVSGMALGVLRRLRVASLDRIVREVRHLDTEATRESVASELDGAGSAVRWYGKRLCAFVEPEA